MSVISHALESRLRNWTRRRMARWLARRPCSFSLDRPIISFTFDDFPRSALLTAGNILRENQFIGTYYTSFGLMGRTTPTGEAFRQEDLDEFARQNHELACHTFDHCDSWETPSLEFERSIKRNQQAVKQALPQFELSTLSYPISYPRPLTKRLTEAHYTCARGGGQTFNSQTTDLNHLKAFFLEQINGDTDAVKGIVDASCNAKGWLIFATHDVSKTPTRYGCTPQLFNETVKYVANSGATVLPVREALRVIQRSRSAAIN